MPHTFWILLGWIVFVSRAVAHDPGLSAIYLERDGGRLQVRLLAAVGDLSTDQRAALPALARSAVECQAGNLVLEPVFAGGHLESGEVELRMVYRDPGGPVSLRSQILATLPRGHRQGVNLVGTDGGFVTVGVLSADDPSFTWSAPAGSGTTAVRVEGPRSPRVVGRWAILGGAVLALGLWCWWLVRLNAREGSARLRMPSAICD